MIVPCLQEKSSFANQDQVCNKKRIHGRQRTWIHRYTETDRNGLHDHYRRRYSGERTENYWKSSRRTRRRFCKIPRRKSFWYNPRSRRRRHRVLYKRKLRVFWAERSPERAVTRRSSRHLRTVRFRYNRRQRNCRSKGLFRLPRLLCCGVWAENRRRNISYRKMLCGRHLQRDRRIFLQSFW